MKRKLICLSVVALMSITAMAQLEKGSFYYIPRIGLSLSNLTHQEIYAGFNEGSNKSEGKWKAGVVARNQGGGKDSAFVCIATLLEQANARQVYSALSPFFLRRMSLSVVPFAKASKSTS